MFGCDAWKSATTLRSRSSSSGDACQPFRVTVPEGAALAAFPVDFPWLIPAPTSRAIAIAPASAVKRRFLMLFPPLELGSQGDGSACDTSRSLRARYPRAGKTGRSWRCGLANVGRASVRGRDLAARALGTRLLHGALQQPAHQL